MRKHITKVTPLSPPVVLQVGMVVSIYMDRADVGSGTRQYLVTRVGRRFVTLFYVPQLKSIRIKNKDWALLARTVRVDDTNLLKLAAGVEEQVDKYIRHQFQYSTVEVERVMGILLANTKEAA